jgi:hypothetical protein
MKFQKAIAICWVTTLLLLCGAASWQEFPILAAHPDMPYLQMLRMQMGIMLKPAMLVPWAVLVATGIFWSWARRSSWRAQRGVFYVFAMCSFSVLWFGVLLVFLRYKAGTN